MVSGRIGQEDDMHIRTLIRRPASLLVVGCLIGLPGCGTNFDEILRQSVSATGRTFFDSLLTDLANTLADSFDGGEALPPGDGDDDGDNGGDTTPPDGPPLDQLTGDPAAGEGIYISNGCAACHCPDAGGGCALSAPSLVGVGTGTLDDRLRGDVDHPGGKFNFTNQDIVDLRAYLVALDAGNG